LYMARRTAPDIAARLMAAGRSAEEPVAIVANAARSDQKVTLTILAGLGLAMAQSPAPAIVVIGENVRLRESLDWLKTLDLSMAD
ncbi:MAG: hypothetical protein ACREEW_09340, partial [Caulobacteraceae bacterium]